LCYFSSLFTGQVGIALNGEWYQPQTNTIEDNAAAEMGMQFVVSNDHPDREYSKIERTWRIEKFIVSRGVD
jgi:hypothetical protein